MTTDNLERILSSLSTFPVLGNSYTQKDFVPLDLSIENKQLQSVNVSSSDDLEVFIWNYMKANKAKVAFGGYIETRGIYNRSRHFNKLDKATERNIHLGLDLWIEANSPIYTPLDGRVHSFNNNDNFGDYGPTILLEHQFDDLKFYTLYGHLSLKSLENKKVGSQVEKGEQIATLGTAEVNGDYPAHLHFQIVLDLQGNRGDYPGVCSQQDVEFYRKNCPDPKLLLDLV